MRRLLRPVWITLAILFLIEAWIWKHVGPWIEWAVARLPFARLKALLAHVIERLPPFATLAVFAIPAALLAPFKLVGLWLIGQGHVIAGALTFLAAKSLGVAVTASLFHLCQPKLMQMVWFARLYALVLRINAWARRQIEPAKRMLRAMKARILSGEGRLVTRILRIRRRGHRRIV